MKKMLLIILSFLSINVFANLNDGKFEVIHKQNNYTYIAKLIVKQSKIIFIDFDKIDDRGVRLSTIDNEFRSSKEITKKYIIENQNLDNIPLKTDKNSKEAFTKLIEFLLEKNKESKVGNFEI